MTTTLQQSLQDALDVEYTREVVESHGYDFELSGSTRNIQIACFEEQLESLRNEHEALRTSLQTIAETGTRSETLQRWGIFCDGRPEALSDKYYTAVEAQNARSDMIDRVAQQLGGEWKRLLWQATEIKCLGTYPACRDMENLRRKLRDNWEEQQRIERLLDCAKVTELYRKYL